MTTAPDAGEGEVIAYVRSEISRLRPSKRRLAVEKFALAAISAIPWVGGFVSAAATLRSEANALRTDNLQTLWLNEHAEKLGALQGVIEEVADRFESLGEEIDERVASADYLDIVREAFRVWDEAATEEKREYVKNLLMNAGGSSITSDDVVRLFVGWIERFHELHFAVIREVYKEPGVTRFEMWDRIHGRLPREDSAEADLFRMLIYDLNTARVIRQARETTPDGRFIRRTSAVKRSQAATTLESSFEDTKPYVLTALGNQFVHYTMNELVRRIAGPRGGTP